MNLHILRTSEANGPSRWWYPLVTTVLPSAVIPVAGSVLLTLVFATERWANEPLHSLVEGVGSFAAIVLAAFIILMRHNNQLRAGYIWVATTLIGMGLLDGFHAGVSPGVSFVWLHSMATFIGGMTFALIVIPERISAFPRLHSAPYIMAAASTLLGIFSVLQPAAIPTMAVNGHFTPTAELLNTVGGLGFLVAWFHFSWREKTDSDEERLLLANHCLLFAIAGLLFHFSTLWDPIWWLWHVLRLFAYLVILWYFLRLYERDANRTRLAQQIIDNTSEAVVVTSPDGTILDINNAYLTITGFSREELIGNNPRISQSGNHDKAFYQRMWDEILAYGTWSGEMWDRRKNGDLFPKWLTINAIKDDIGKTSFYVGIFRDISDKKKTEDKLKNLAFYDTLTSLPNRTLLYDRIDEAIVRAKRGGQLAALMLIDLDGFKDINDSLGHAAGDILLQQVALRIKQRLRKSDTAARLGGDEFCILLGDSNHPEEFASLARQLIDDINQSIIIADQSVYVGASIGIAIFPDDADSRDELIKHADTAMYGAKESGKNTFKFFLREMNEKAVQRLELIKQLHTAVERREFLLHYQPKIRLSDHKIVGMEALVRWPRADGTLTSPTEFISYAEETGLIVSLGNWILSEACRQAHVWNRHFHTELKVAVNLSMRQFHGTDLLGEVTAILDDTGLPADQLELEITESLLMEDTEHAFVLLEKLRAKGISIAIDDFGTGYSSLNYLKHLPVDTLKIDQSFVRDLEHDKENAAIVKAIISLADTLNLKVVGEGVETEKQLEFLKQYRCHEVQGYYLGRPMPAEEFVSLLAAAK